jgi:hypothetical protein
MKFDVDGGGGVSWQCCKVWTSPTKFLTATKQKNTLKIWLQKVCTHTHTHRVIDNSDLRRRLQVLCATIYVCAQEKEFSEKKHS